MKLDGKRVAVAGMGVSGFAIARAVKSLGGTPTVFDQRPADSGSAIQAADDLNGLGVGVVTGWHGRLEPSEFDLYVVSPGFPVTHPSILDMQGGGKEVIGEIEFAFRLTKVPIIAITGTNGKSTTTALTYTFCQARGLNAVLCGNIAGSGFPEKPLTAAAVDHPDADVLVAEVSSYQLETISEFRPRVCTVLNVSPDHMERHASFDEYRQTKLRIFQNCKAGDTIVLDASEESLDWRDVVGSIDPSASLHLVGTSRNIEDLPPNATHVNNYRDGSTLYLGGSIVQADDLKLRGAHQLRNSVIAWSLCHAFKPVMQEEEEVMTQALKEFAGLKNRMEFVADIDGVMVYNNSVATNPDSVIADLDSLDVRQHVLIGGLTKNLTFTRLGKELERKGHTGYVFGPNADEIQEQLGPQSEVYKSLEDAFSAALSRSAPGEAIVLSPACASAYPYSNFIERAQAFVRYVEVVQMRIMGGE